MTTPQEVVDEARTWVGTRFGHQRRMKGSYADCLGLVIGVAINTGLAEEAGFNPLAPENRQWLCYKRQPDPRHMQAGLNRFMEKLQAKTIDDCMPGDILWLIWDRFPQHVAIKSGPDSMIHAYWPEGGVVEHNIGQMWRRKFVAGYRYIGLQPVAQAG